MFKKTIAAVLLAAPPAQAQISNFVKRVDLTPRIAYTEVVLDGLPDPDSVATGTRFGATCRAATAFGVTVDDVSLRLIASQGLSVSGDEVTADAFGVQTLRCDKIFGRAVHERLQVINVRAPVVDHLTLQLDRDASPNDLLELGESVRVVATAYDADDQVVPPALLSFEARRGYRGCRATTQLGGVQAHGDQSATITTEETGVLSIVATANDGRGGRVCASLRKLVRADAHAPEIEVSRPAAGVFQRRAGWTRVSGYVSDTAPDGGIARVTITNGPHGGDARLYRLRDGRTYFTLNVMTEPGLNAIQIEAVDNAGYTALATRALQVGESIKHLEDVAAGSPAVVRVGARAFTDSAASAALEGAIRDAISEMELDHTWFARVEGGIRRPDMDVRGRARVGRPEVRLWLAQPPAQRQIMVDVSFPEFRADVSLKCDYGELHGIWCAANNEDGGYTIHATATGTMSVRGGLTLGEGPNDFGLALNTRLETLEFPNSLRVTNSANDRPISERVFRETVNRFRHRVKMELTAAFCHDNDPGTQCLVAYPAPLPENELVPPFGEIGFTFQEAFGAPFALERLVGAGESYEGEATVDVTETSLTRSHLGFEFDLGITPEEVVHEDVGFVAAGVDAGAPMMERLGTPQQDFDAAVHVDTINGALYAAWAAGAFDLELSMAELVALSGGRAPVTPLPEATLRVRATLPPRLAEYANLEPGMAYAQIGGVQVDFEMPEHDSRASIQGSLVARANLGFAGGAFALDLAEGEGCEDGDDFTTCGRQRSLGVVVREGLNASAGPVAASVGSWIGAVARNRRTASDADLAEAIWARAEGVLVDTMNQQVNLALVELTSQVASLQRNLRIADGDLNSVRVDVEEGDFVRRPHRIDAGWIMLRADLDPGL